MRTESRLLTLILLWTLAAFSTMAQTLQETYIRTYSSLAVKEMHRSGVPASITLAQGMLESGNGSSRLAVDGNNHFGIKCHNDWTGERIYHDDDRKGECFRKYSHPEQSYRDHSDFLRYRERYSFLFDLDPQDYKGWAYGLKKAGYATDPSYPAKLIAIIEDYRLYEYDRRKNSSDRDVIPLPPSRIVQPDRIDASESRRYYFNLSLSRQVYSLNGVAFVYASEGETYSSLAAAYGLFLKEILKFNDLDESQDILPGTVVYLQRKKSKAAKGLDKHVVEGNETLRDVAQRYAVRLKKLCSLNLIDENQVLVDGDVLKLRK